MFQIIKLNEETEEDDDVIHKQIVSAAATSSSSLSSSTSLHTTSLSESSSYSFDTIQVAPTSIATFSILSHSDLILNSLKSLKSNKILCDITLIAESKWLRLLYNLPNSVM